MKTIEELAREAGIILTDVEAPPPCYTLVFNGAATRRFATLVRAEALEEAAKVCEGEYLEEPQPGTEDAAYDYAVRDCAIAIRALKDKP